MDDLFLIKQTLNGNRDAFKLIVLRYQRPVFKFLNAFQLSTPVIEEIAQEAFLRAYKSLSGYDSSKGASFSSWLFTITRNLAINELERYHRHAEVLVSDDEQNTVEEIPPEDPTVDDVIDSKLSAVRVKEALKSLPLQFRTAIVLSFLKDFSLEEISQIEGCSIGTVKSRVHRGKQLLRTNLLSQEGVIS